METALVIRPKRWLLFGSIVALIVLPIALLYVPNAFDIAPGERPVRFFIVLWLLLPVLLLLAAWRLLTWTTFHLTAEAIEVRTWLGGTRLAWSDLKSAELQTPVGMPPAYELRFSKRKVRLIAAHHALSDIRTLRAYVRS